MADPSFLQASTRKQLTTTMYAMLMCRYDISKPCTLEELSDSLCYPET